MNTVVSRPYLPADRSACLGIFDSNVPRFFAPAERAEFRNFLDGIDAGGRLFYLVLIHHGAVIACGGLVVEADQGQAGLAWGMVDRSLHGQGLGTSLTRARLDLARAIPGIAALTLATSQHTRGFYEGFGFAVTNVAADGFGPGLDRCDMVLRLI